MPDAPALLAFVFGTVVVLATPGVTVSAITGTTIRHGRTAGFAMEAGVMLARLSMLTLLALGLEAVGRMMAELFDLIKFAGAAYLVWLGLRMIRHPPLLAAEGAVAPVPRLRLQPVSGFVVLWTNPKAFIFFGAFLPQFVDPAAPVAPQVALLGAIWIGVAAVTDGLYILLAGGARHLMRGALARRVGWISGTILMAGGVWLALQRKA